MIGRECTFALRWATLISVVRRRLLFPPLLALSALAAGCGQLPAGPIVVSGAGESAADGGAAAPSTTTIPGETEGPVGTDDTTVATVIIDESTTTADPTGLDPQTVADDAVAVALEMEQLEFVPIDAGALAAETCPGVPVPDVAVPAVGLARTRFARDVTVGPFIDYSARSFTTEAEASEWIETLRFRYIECAQSATVIEGRELPSTRTVDAPVAEVADTDQILGLQNEVYFTDSRQELFVVIQTVVIRKGPYVAIVTFTGGGPSTPDAMAGLASYATTKLP